MEKMVKFCVLRMMDKSIIEEQQCAVIAYGLDLLFSSTINILTVLFLSVIIDRAGGMILLLLTSIPLQSFGGGYHCNTRFMCWILTTGGYLAALFGAVHLPINILFCAALGSAYPFLRFSPVENPKAPFGEIFKEKMKKVVRITYFVGILASLILLVFQSEGVRFILAGISLEGISVFAAEYKHKINLK